MFHTRAILHRRAYQHKTACAVELMYENKLNLQLIFTVIIRITDALVAANDEVHLYGEKKSVPF